MSNIQDFIFNHENHQRAILLYLHNLLTDPMNLTAKIRYKIPFYYGKTWICYLNPIKSTAVELALIRGSELSNEQGILEHKGRKQVWGITYTNVSEISIGVLSEVLYEAILLDQELAYVSKRKSSTKK